MKQLKTEIKFTIELTDQEVKTICEALNRVSDQDDAEITALELRSDDDDFNDIDAKDLKELKKSVKAMDKLHGELASLIYDDDED